MPHKEIVAAIIFQDRGMATYRIHFPFAFSPIPISLAYSHITVIILRLGPDAAALWSSDSIVVYRIPRVPVSAQSTCPPAATMALLKSHRRPIWNVDPCAAADIAMMSPRRQPY